MLNVNFLKIYMKKLFVSIICSILFVTFTYAQTQELKVSKYTIVYDTIYSADTNDDKEDDRFSYYLKENLVFTSFDSDYNGTIDLYLRFDEDLNVNMELYDNDEDGEIDKEVFVDPQENIISDDPTVLPKVIEKIEKDKIPIVEKEASKENSFLVQKGGYLILAWVLFFLIIGIIFINRKRK